MSTNLAFKNIFHFSKGEKYAQLARYMGPEMVTSLLLFSALTLVDAKLIADLGSYSIYASLGVATSAFHLLVKVGESFMAATVIMGGRYNGRGDYQGAGKTFVNTFWITLGLGIIISLLIYILAPWYYQIHQFTPETIALGSSFLRLKAISIFLMFVYLAFAGFFKSIKNTRLPMIIFSIGALFFVIFDFLLIKGVGIFPALGLIGSAVASIVQYSIMVSICLIYICKKYRKNNYKIQFFQFPNLNEIKAIFSLTWPVIIDKATLMFGYIWLGIMLSHIGGTTLASFTVLRDIMGLACIPAQAAAHVISFIASNNAGRQLWDDILINVQKIIWFTFAIMLLIYCTILFNAERIVGFFDSEGNFSTLAIWALFPMSLLVFGDLLQLVLSGAIRGVGKVNFVMWSRLFCIFIFFVPVSYWITKQSFQNSNVKFLTIFASFYASFFLMAAFYIWIFNYGSWQMRHFAFEKNG